MADTEIHWAIFLSTPSARRATKTLGHRPQAQNISIHALREEGDLETNALPIELRISIHALREEGDFDTIDANIKRTISIHALREEGDRSTS